MTSGDITGYNNLFLKTATEHVSAIENILSGTTSMQSMEELFRQVHSLKGSSEVMGQNDISKICSEIISYIRPNETIVMVNEEIWGKIKTLTEDLKKQLRIFEPEGIGDMRA